MRSWSLGINSLPEYKHGAVYAYDEPFWLWLVGIFVDYILAWICCSGCNPIARIPLPNIFPRKRDEDSDELFTLQEWYGNFGDVCWIHIYDPIFQWYWKHHGKYEHRVDIGYDKLKEIFGESYPDTFAQEKEDVKEE